MTRSWPRCADAKGHGMPASTAHPDSVFFPMIDALAVAERSISDHQQTVSKEREDPLLVKLHGASTPSHRQFRAQHRRSLRQPMLPGPISQDQNHQHQNTDCWEVVDHFGTMLIPLTFLRMDRSLFRH